MQTGGRVARRLAWYWQVELANAVFLPALFIAYAFALGEGLRWPVAAALVPVCALLVIGGLYWRGKLHELRGDGRALEQTLAIAHHAQLPVLGLTGFALLIGIGGMVLPVLGSRSGDSWSPLIAGLLALAEYVNYYHRQLQHFDNWPDFRRLITGKGFRPAKMAVDLATWRAAQGKP
jgi:hypothetical protein